MDDAKVMHHSKDNYATQIYESKIITQNTRGLKCYSTLESIFSYVKKSNENEFLQ